MNHHKKTYENVFSEDHPKNSTRLNIDQSDADGMELNEYILLSKNFLKEMYSDLFLICVKISWIRRKFIYYGNKTVLPMQKNTRLLRNAYTKLLRRNIGHDIQIITKSRFFSKLEVYYFDKFFPNFEEENPFINPEYYKFPFENISMEFLTVVYQLDERMELLKEADKKEMSYATFLDYVLNHTLCENELLGYDKYELTQSADRKSPYYIRINKKNKYE